MASQLWYVPCATDCPRVRVTLTGPPGQGAVAPENARMKVRVVIRVGWKRIRLLIVFRFRA